MQREIINQLGRERIKKFYGTLKLSKKAALDCGMITRDQGWKPHTGQCASRRRRRNLHRRSLPLSPLVIPLFCIPLMAHRVSS